MADTQPLLVFDTGFEPQTGQPVAVAPGLARVTAANRGPYTFTGTNSFLVGEESVALLDPGPAEAGHHAALVKAIIAAKRRRVKVRVMLNPVRRSGEGDNEATRRALRRAGVDVKNPNPAFDLTHEKSMVVDDTVAFVKSLNWTTKNFTETRDYAVMTDRKRDVAEVIDGFEADWHRQAFTPRMHSHLIWCPGPGRDRICDFMLSLMARPAASSAAVLIRKPLDSRLKLWASIA